jgi:hypothetical protein
LDRSIHDEVLNFSNNSIEAAGRSQRPIMPEYRAAATIYKTSNFFFEFPGAASNGVQASGI